MQLVGGGDGGGLFGGYAGPSLHSNTSAELRGVLLLDGRTGPGIIFSRPLASTGTFVTSPSRRRVGMPCRIQCQSAVGSHHQPLSPSSSQPFPSSPSAYISSSGLVSGLVWTLGLSINPLRLSNSSHETSHETGYETRIRNTQIS
jgi:hypothetical protein